MDVTFFASAEEFRAWLAEQHDHAREVWVGFHKKGSGATRLAYAEAVDEALCFGWIDGVRKSLDERRYTIRFTPRQPNSIWSAVNIRRAGELAALGRLHPAGAAAFAARDQGRERQYSYEEEARDLDGAYAEEFRAHGAAWDFFQVQPASYRRAANWWVMSAKSEETRRRRLATLIAESAQGRRLAQFSRPARREQT